MKKLLALVLCLGLVSGCSTSASTTKVGTGSITSFKTADASTEKDGQVQVNTTIASVGLDKDGKITYVNFDVAQNSGKVDTTGAVSVSEDTKTKKEKGADYGMVKASNIGKEWFEQIASFETYIVGKTLDEVKAIELSEGVATSEDLTSEVTIKLTDYIAALEKAVANAQEVSGVAKIGTASYTTMKATSATAEKAGSVQANVTYGVVAMDKNDKVVYAGFDVAQNKGEVSSTGTVSVSADTPTKVEKGDAYGMKKASAIGKEWYEQMASFEAWMVGKTSEEILNIEVDDTGVTTVEDLTSSVTIKLSDYLATFEKAITNATEVK